MRTNTFSFDVIFPNWYTSVCSASLAQLTLLGLIEKNNIVSSSFEIELINLFQLDMNSSGGSPNPFDHAISLFIGIVSLVSWSKSDSCSSIVSSSVHPIKSRIKKIK